MIRTEFQDTLYRHQNGRDGMKSISRLYYYNNAISVASEHYTELMALKHPALSRLIVEQYGDEYRTPEAGQVTLHMDNSIGYVFWIDTEICDMMYKSIMHNEYKDYTLMNLSNNELLLYRYERPTFC